MSTDARDKRLARVVHDLLAIKDPLARLDAVRRAREELERVEQQSIADSRQSGVTWGAIGQLYGLTKQGAQQRFRPGRSASSEGR